MIKFNSIHLFICSFFFIVLFSSCSHDSIDTSVSRLKDTDVVELTQTPETNFTVSNGTLSKYLKLFYKGKAIDKVEPIIKDGDILGYLVQYSNNNGWDVISSDIRLSPVLLSCPEGKIDLTKSEDKLMIQGMIEPYYAKRKEKSGNAINGTWAFLLGKTKIQSASPSGLLPSTKSQNKVNGRGLGQGMWLPVDTTIRERMITSPRLTSAMWCQGTPFNKYTPKDNSKHCPVGCGPVAAGQLLHAFFRNSPGQHLIPSTADTLNPNNTFFSHFTTTAWSQLVLNHNGADSCDSTAVFLAWIG
ncbi:MAG: C10 family peptidase, partial [Bacteroidales bacterium]|nr:C10 family peptidase [Bacteroidales bacterium]